MQRQMDTVFGRSLIGAVGLSQGFIDEAIRKATASNVWDASQALQVLRDGVAQFEPLLAEHLSDAVLAGWIAGYDNVAGQLPLWLQQEFTDSIRRGPPGKPPTVNLFGMFDREPRLKLVNVENAAMRLMERGIMTRPQFDAAKQSAQREAFTIAGDLGTQTIDRMRYLLYQELSEGPSLKGFENRINESLGTSPIAPGHLENVYRTNLQAAYRDGRETLRRQPLVAAAFPYQAYFAVHDRRARNTHRMMETLGLNGTNVYRSDDPVWDYFTPPWDYNCRCGVRLMTLEQAAQAGVQEAIEWLRTGRPPINPEYRLSAIPFEHNEGFGHRGNVGIIVMSASRAPSGYSHDQPLVINGKNYIGGQFIPSSELEHATAEQKAEIATGRKAEPPKPQKVAAPTHPEIEPPPNWVARLKKSYQIKLPDGYGAKIKYDSKAKGYYFRLSGPDGSQQFADRYKTIDDAAKHAATLLHVRGLGKPKEAPKQQPSESKPRQRKQAKTNQGNWHYKSVDFVSRGAKTKFRDNLEALRTLRTVQMEDREPTESEKEAMSKFVGWGQFPQVFDPGHRSGMYPQWRKEREELRSMVGESAFDSAAKATINSHFTAPDVIQAHWKMAERLGFNGGRMLEPAVGSGYYLGLMPEHLASKTNVTAIEMDQESGALAKALYPSANVYITPFQDHATPKDFFDLVATNVPFSEGIRIKYGSMRPTLHDYYFLRSIDTAKPGGLIMQLTSAGTMDKLDPRVRAKIEKECELVSAIRFPGDTHKDNAGTSVVTDMLILRKKNPSIPPAPEEVPPEALPPGSRWADQPIDRMTNEEFNKKLIEARANGEDVKGSEPSVNTGRFTGTTVDSLGRLYHWVDGVRVAAPRWDDLVTVPDPNGGEPIPVNRYFAEHPEQILGTIDRTGTMYTGNQMNVSRTDDYEQRLNDAIQRLPQGIFNPEKSIEKEDTRVILDDGDTTLNGQYLVQDGRVYKKVDGAIEPQALSEIDTERAIGQIAIRNAARKLLDAQQRGLDTNSLREELNSLYDDFVSKHGSLHERHNKLPMRNDADAPFLLALEHYNSTTKQVSKADIFSIDTILPDSKATSASNVAEAVGISMHEYGKIDIDRIAKLTGKSIETVEDELIDSGVAFDVPGHGWQDAAEYLSGNTRKKLKEAIAAAASDPRYEPNVKALEASQPVDIPTDEIGIKLTSPWVPDDVLEKFFEETVGADPGDFKIKYIPQTQTYDVMVNKWISYRDAVDTAWSVKRASGKTVFTFEDAIRAALSGKSPVIYHPKGLDDNKTVDIESTEDAKRKVEELKAQFKDWVWEDQERADRLTTIYNQSQNVMVERKFDGSHLQLPGIVATFKPRKVQKDFVWRVISTGRGLAAHEVGYGKTASMIAAAMELRRLGLAKKPCLACLKANIEQMTQEALELYPNAKILSISKFDTENRQKVLNQIATGDYDLVIITHNNLEAMKLRPDNVKKFIDQEIKELEDTIVGIQTQQHDNNQDRTQARSITKNLNERKLKLEQQLKEAMDNASKDEIYFEDTGIDQLFVDEAHHFKSLPCVSKQRVKGVPMGRSERATDMYAKTRYLLDKHNGRGVVFATGTPIVNTMAELYNLQRFLQPDLLKEHGLEQFDAWKETFGETQNNMEFKLTGKVDSTERFSKFVNVPELRHLTSDFMDIQRIEWLKDANGKPLIKRPTKHDDVIVSESNDEIERMMAGIHRRAEAMKRGGKATKGEDNMLNVCNDAKMGSIDMRLIDAEAPDHPMSKANRAINEIVRIYKEHPGKTQCVFSDLGINETKKTGFSLFEDMKRKLVEAGIPKEHIVDFSDDSMKGAKRLDAQEAMKRGDIRIAFGSTPRLGTGTNIQKNLYAVHHLDIPYVPAVLEQRDGRGHRSGNQNEDFHAYRYVQQGSADPLFWQILANKVGFINQYMRGDKSARTMEDIAADELSPDEMIEIASGGTDTLDRIKNQQEVERLRRLKMRHEVDQTKIHAALQNVDQTRERYRREHERRSIDADYFDNQKDWSMVIDGRKFTERSEAKDALQAAIQRAHASLFDSRGFAVRETAPIGKYRGADLHVNKGGMLLLEGPSGETYQSGTQIPSIDYVARTIGKKVEEAKKRVENYEKDVEKMRSSVGKPFRYSEELAKAVQRQTELENARQMKLHRAETEALKMSMVPGTEKVVDGRTYVLNEHHRWQGKKDEVPQQPPSQPKQQSPQPQPKQQKPAKVQPAPKAPIVPQIDRAVAAKAAEEGDSPEHRQARMAVAMHYLTNIAKTYDHVTKSMKPLDSARAKGMADGIDFSKPVKIGPPPTIPPPDKLIQWQAPGGFRGSYFSVQGASPADLGIHDHAKAWTEPGQPVKPREQKLYDTRKAKLDRVTYLQSITAPTIDTWSVPGTPVPVSGGGVQYFVPVASNPSVRVADATKHAK